MSEIRSFLSSKLSIPEPIDNQLFIAATLHNVEKGANSRILEFLTKSELEMIVRTFQRRKCLIYLTLVCYILILFFLMFYLEEVCTENINHEIDIQRNNNAVHKGNIEFFNFQNNDPYCLPILALFFIFAGGISAIIIIFTLCCNGWKRTFILKKNNLIFEYVMKSSYSEIFIKVTFPDDLINQYSPPDLS